MSVAWSANGRVRLALLAAILSFAAAGVQPADASCSCPSFNAAAIVDASAQVALVRVMNVEVVANSCGGRLGRSCDQKVSLDVVRWLRGSGGSELQWQISNDPHHCGLPLAEGQQLLLFAAKPEASIMSICLVYAALDDPVVMREVIRLLSISPR